jgi:hypothetical protein
LELKQFDATRQAESNDAAPLTTENQMPPMKKGICEGCGKEKTLLSRTLCHQCVKDKQKEDEPKKEERQAVKVALDFSLDADLLHELTASAHRNYRTLSNEILSTLRASTEKLRPRADGNG